jgi:hypothetical protein
MKIKELVNKIKYSKDFDLLKELICSNNDNQIFMLHLAKRTDLDEDLYRFLFKETKHDKVVLSQLAINEEISTELLKEILDYSLANNFDFVKMVSIKRLNKRLSKKT